MNETQFERLSWKKLLTKLYKELTVVHVELEINQDLTKDQRLLYTILGQCIMKVEKYFEYKDLNDEQKYDKLKWLYEYIYNRVKKFDS